MGHLMLHKVAHKSRPIRLTVYIFKTPKKLCNDLTIIHKIHSHLCTKHVTLIYKKTIIKLWTMF